MTHQAASSRIADPNKPSKPTALADAHLPVYIELMRDAGRSVTQSDRIAERELEEPERWDGMG